MKCGLVMPISAMKDYPESHFDFVRKTIIEVIRKTGFDNNPELVSHDPTDMNITKRIFSNLYENELIICVVSGYNPNVFYELGLRVAFDMPCIIVKDEKTRFAFDISQFEQVIYPDNIEKYNRLKSVHEKFKQFKSNLEYKIISYLELYNKGKSIKSPLEGFLVGTNYLKARRQPHFKLAGQYEYKCFITKTGYSHGGVCLIEPVVEDGYFIEWKLLGKRFYKKESKTETIEFFDEPYHWETNKAVVFPDKTFMVSYEIKAQKNITGFIDGRIELLPDSNSVKAFLGRYHQDEGDATIKGGNFKMAKIEHYTEDYKFKLLPRM